MLENTHLKLMSTPYTNFFHKSEVHKNQHLESAIIINDDHLTVLNKLKIPVHGAMLNFGWGLLCRQR